MLTDITEDNAGRPVELPAPDAHGQASMLLVESLIHGLIARSGLSVAEAVEIVDSAAEVQAEIEAERGSEPAPLRNGSTLLEAIRQSLVRDLPDPVLLGSR